MAPLILPLRLLGALLLLGALPACSTSRTVSRDAPPPSGAPPSGSALSGPDQSVTSSTGGGGVPSSIGVPPSSGSGGR